MGNPRTYSLRCVTEPILVRPFDAVAWDGTDAHAADIGLLCIHGEWLCKRQWSESDDATWDGHGWFEAHAGDMFRRDEHGGWQRVGSAQEFAALYVETPDATPVEHQQAKRLA